MVEEYLLEEDDEKLSICCGERLTHYDVKWDDGRCIKCGEHSARKGGRNDCVQT